MENQNKENKELKLITQKQRDLIEKLLKSNRILLCDKQYVVRALKTCVSCKDGSIIISFLLAGINFKKTFVRHYTERKFNKIKPLATMDEVQADMESDYYASEQTETDLAERNEEETIKAIKNTSFLKASFGNFSHKAFESTKI